MNDDWSIRIGAEGITPEQVKRLVDDQFERTRSALALYRWALDAGMIKSLRILTYRHRVTKRRCLLADVFTTPAGPAVYIPPVRLSPDANIVTDADARIERTSDGDRRWVEHADLLMPPGPANHPLEYWLSCDHLQNHVVPAADVHAAMKRGDREILV